MRNKIIFLTAAVLFIVSAVNAQCVNDSDCSGVCSECVGGVCCAPEGTPCNGHADCCFTGTGCYPCTWDYDCKNIPIAHYANCLDACTVHWGCECMNCPGRDLYTDCCVPFCEGHYSCSYYCDTPDYMECAYGTVEGCCGGKDCDCVIGVCGAVCLDGQTRACSNSETWNDYCSGENFIDYDWNGINDFRIVTCTDTQTCAGCVWPVFCCDPPDPTPKDWGLCDSSMESCTICCGAYWSIGGDVSPTTCCEDDPGENRIVCSKGAGVGENACGADAEACCPQPDDCVYNDGCYRTGWCHPVFRNIYCNSGTWSYDISPPVITITKPSGPILKDGIDPREVEFDITEGHCDIIENTVSVNLKGYTWRNQSYNQNSATFDGSAHCNSWGQDYWSPYPNPAANSMDCSYGNEPLMQPGAFTLTVCASDAAGNNDCKSVSIKYLANSSIENLCYRWNAISLPTIPVDPVTGDLETNPRTSPVLQGLPYDRLSRYRNLDIFDAFAPELAALDVHSLNNLGVGVGYYMFITEETASPPNPCLDQYYWGIPTAPVLDLNGPGRYFFGIQQNSSLLKDNIGTALSNNNIEPNEYEGVYYLDKSQNVPYGRFIEYPSGFTEFETGKGYWINYTGWGDTLPLY
ncbi:MAG: hypothetical protein U9M95_03620 [Candidatus Altiarchaeota archaeon]|nr:hypothetical protein [Candidatus Altiarchaeota archaeon]